MKMILLMALVFTLPRPIPAPTIHDLSLAIVHRTGLVFKIRYYPTFNATMVGFYDDVRPLEKMEIITFCGDTTKELRAMTAVRVEYSRSSPSRTTACHVLMGAGER